MLVEPNPVPGRPTRGAARRPPPSGSLGGRYRPPAPGDGGSAGRCPAQPAKSAAPAAKTGLDALDDRVVMTELSKRQLDSLFNRYVDVNKVSKEDVDAFKALQSLYELSADKPMAERRRVELIRQALGGLNKVLPTIKDPLKLMDYAGILVSKGIEPDINILEYWGENPTLQQRLRPVTAITSQMLKQVAVAAKAEADSIESSIQNNDPRIPRWEKLDAMKDQAVYVDNMIAYYVAMSIDVSGPNKIKGMGERTKIVNDAVTYLKQYDNPAPEGIMPMIHNRLGKLMMIKGDYPAARKYFDAVITGQLDPKKKMDPRRPSSSSMRPATSRSSATCWRKKRPTPTRG